MAFAYQMTAAGADKVERVEVAQAEPAAHEVLIRMRASSMNYHDFVTLSGFIPWVEYPTVPLSDGCGEIVALGADVDGYAVGDRVLCNFYPRWHSGRPSPENKAKILGENTDGCLQEFLCIDAASVAKAPEHMSDAEAATLVCAGLTAWYPMLEENQLQPDQTVLLQGTGGVSLAGLQIAKAIGARVVITSSSDEKLQRCREMGADILINYRENENWEDLVLEQTGGVDITLDTGGQNTLAKAVHCTRPDGFIAVIGVLGGIDAVPLSVIDIMQKNIALKGVTVGCRDSLDRLCRFTEQHQLHPVISDSFKASEIEQAAATMAAGSHFGKIAIEVC